MTNILAIETSSVYCSIGLAKNKEIYIEHSEEENTHGKNIFGFSSYMPGRLAGFFNDELIMGHYYYGFVLIVLSFLYGFLKKENLIIIKKLNFKIINQNLIYFLFLFF